jgi:4-hydroxy-tetrahydrodipicolinate synthase
MTSAALSPAPLGRVLTAMVTAFDDDGAVDLDATARVAAHLVDHGCDGVVVSGTTGESPTTTVSEDADILRAVVETVGDRANVVAGVGTNSTAHSVELAEQAAKIGADGVLVVTPYYNKPTQEGVLAHFREVASVSDLPVMLYDIPGRTGIPITPDTYRRIAETPHVVAVKDAVGDIPRGVQIMADTGLVYYSGDDALNLAWLTHGGAGVVSVVAHAASRDYAGMVSAVERGDLVVALETYRRLAPLVDLMMTRVQGAMTAKAVMQLLGVLDNRAMRLPLVAAPDDVVDDLRRLMTDLDLLEGTTS